MNGRAFCFTVDDVCYEGYSTEEHLYNLLEFWRKEDIKATLFVVPLAPGKKLKERVGYIKLLKQAISQGHEIAQHGLEHNRFESGIPPPMILDLPHEGPARERLARHREEIEKSHTLKNLRRMLRDGRQILEQALRYPIKGFRAPSGAICKNLYYALQEEGYGYDSSKIFQEAGWDIIKRKKDILPRPITRNLFNSQQTGRNLLVLPITSEYTWYLKKEVYNMALGLARHDFDACLESEIPFIPLCHVSPIQEGENDCGFELYRRLIDYARKKSSASGLELEMLTLSQVYESFRKGKL